MQSGTQQNRRALRAEQQGRETAEKAITARKLKRSVSRGENRSTGMLFWKRMERKTKIIWKLEEPNLAGQRDQHLEPRK